MYFFTSIFAPCQKFNVSRVETRFVAFLNWFVVYICTMIIYGLGVKLASSSHAFIISPMLTCLLLVVSYLQVEESSLVLPAQPSRNPNCYTKFHTPLASCSHPTLSNYLATAIYTCINAYPYHQVRFSIVPCACSDMGRKPSASQRSCDK